MTPPKSILVTRLDGLGDIVLSTGLLHGLHQLWPDTGIRMLVRPPHGRVSTILPDWVNVAALPFDPRVSPVDREEQVVSHLRATAEVCRADLFVISEHNRVWAGEILSVLSGATTVAAFDGPCGLNVHHRPLLERLGITVDSQRWMRVPIDADSRETAKYQAMFHALGGGQLPPPSLVVSAAARERALTLARRLELPLERTVVCFPSSGDLLEKSLGVETWRDVISDLVATHGRKVVLLGGERDRDVLANIAGGGLADGVVQHLIAPDDVQLLAGLLAITEAYVGADTGPMHIAAALGRPTLGVFGGGHWPRFLPAGPRTLVVRMPMACYGCQWHCPFSTRICITRLPIDRVRAGVATLLNGMQERDPLEPRVLDAAPPAELVGEIGAAVQRLHERVLAVNHAMIEHHEHLNAQCAAQRGQLDRLHEDHGRHTQALAEMSRQNESRDRAIAECVRTSADMTRQNQARDRGIAEQQRALTEMTRQNESRDRAIAAHGATFDEMTEQNEARDVSIHALNEQNAAHIQTLSEMTRANSDRDSAIARQSETLAGLSKQLAKVREELNEKRSALERETERQAALVEESQRLQADMREQLDDIRRRGIRVPLSAARLWRKLTGGRSGPPAIE